MSHPQPTRPTTPPPPPRPSNGNAWVSSITSTLTADEARSLTDEIVAKLARLVPLVKRAYEGRADKALGYSSWHDYCATELGGIRIPLSDRPAAVAELREAGMSTRAIGSALGTSEATVRRELRHGDAVEPAKVISLDGRERPATMPKGQDVAEKILAAIDERTAAPSTSSGQEMSPEERDKREEKRLAIAAARRTAKTLVSTVMEDVATLLGARELGVPGLITPQMIAGLRRAVELLEGELHAVHLDVTR